MLNEIVIMGRLTRAPELKATPSGTSVCEFTIACERDFEDSNGDKQTDFINIIAWRSTAEFISRYFSKGQLILIKGRLQIRTWSDNEGSKRKVAEIVADKAYFADSKKSSGSGNAQEAQSHFPQSVATNCDNFAEFDGDDDLPF